MNIGSLYLVKKRFWLLFPTKETAADAAGYWGRHYNCEITGFSPGSYVVFLEEDGKVKRVLTADGRIGWFWFDESYNDCFEEMNP